MLRRLTAAFLMLAPVMAHAQATAREDVSNFTLDNGMEVVVIEDHRAPAVMHMVWYKAGSADEEPGVSGVAHYLEHLLFKGTEKMEPGEFSRVVAANGGSDNAFTSYDYTGYFQRVAADRLGLMMEMEADRMVNIQLTQADILTEREVVIEERNQRVENDPGSLLREQMRAALYMNHRYGVPIIGWRHEMETLVLEDALAYYERHYAPNNAILVVSGDVTPEEVRTLAEATYGQIPANPAVTERIRPSEPRHLTPRRLEMRDPRVAQPYVIRSYLAPERDRGAQEKAAALVMLSEVLSGGQTSVLRQALEFDSKIAVYSAAFYQGISLDESSFTFLVVPSEGVSLQEAEDALEAELARFIETGVDEEQLARIKFQIEAQQIYALDNADGRARRYGAALASGLTVEDVQAWPGILQAVTGEDIVQAARDLLDERRSVTAWLMRDEEVTQ